MKHQLIQNSDLELIFNGNEKISKSQINRCKLIICAINALTQASTWQSIKSAFQNSGISPASTEIVLKNPHISSFEKPKIKIDAQKPKTKISISSRLLTSSTLINELENRTTEKLKEKRYEIYFLMWKPKEKRK